MGAALAVVVTLHGPLRSRIRARCCPVAATLGFVVVVLPWFASNATRVHDVFYGRFGLLAYSCATAIVIWRLAQPSSGVLEARFELSPVIWVGAISYEMYLWHWPLYLVITPERTGVSGVPLLFVRLASVVALAAVTHFYVGEPIRRGVRLRSPKLRGSRPLPSSSRSASASSPRPSARVRCSAATSGRWRTDGGRRRPPHRRRRPLR